MNINQSIITLILLLIVSGIIIGCASKLTEEQAIVESQALSDGIKNRFSGRSNLSKIDLPATKRVGNKNLRLVLLSRRASLRWLGEAGFKFGRNSRGITNYRRAGNTTSRGFRSRSGNYRGDDPRYIYFNNSPVLITGGASFGDPQAGKGILYIFDQYDDVRVVTYEQY